MDSDLSTADENVEADFDKMKNLVRAKKIIRIERERIIAKNRKTEETDWLSESEVKFIRCLEEVTDYLDECRRNNIYVNKEMFPDIKLIGKNLIEYQFDSSHSNDITIFGGLPFWNPDFIEHPKIDNSDNFLCSNDNRIPPICSNNPPLPIQVPTCPSDRCEGLDGSERLIYEMVKREIQAIPKWDLVAEGIEKNCGIDDFNRSIENNEKVLMPLISGMDIKSHPFFNFTTDPQFVNQENLKLKIALERLFISTLKLEKIWPPTILKLPKCPNFIRSHLDSSSLKKEGRNSEFSDSGGALKIKYPVLGLGKPK